MRYYIVQKGETLNYILEKFHLSSEAFQELNGQLKMDSWAPGLKIIVSNEAIKKTIKTNPVPTDTPVPTAVHQLYQKNDLTFPTERQFICPHCKKIILIPLPKETKI